VLVASVILYKLADFVARFAREENVGKDQVGIYIFQANQRSFTIGDGDNLKAFLAQNSFPHTLSMRAVVSQQDPVHADC
jgi:hypothetical protein